VHVAGHKFFRDHHRYEQAEFAALAKEARSAGADALICTEKDTLNLAGVNTSEMEIFYCVISLCVGRGDEFWSALMSIATERKASRSVTNETLA
jgi:tetraacyldisaccharide-1-P 4'-kinase